MTIAALSWPAASLYIALIISIALVVAVLIWSIFRTGQSAITGDSRKRWQVARAARSTTSRRSSSTPVTPVDRRQQHHGSPSVDSGASVLGGRDGALRHPRPGT
jgi:hypothetical protein